MPRRNKPDPKIPLIPNPRGVFIGADDRIPTLKNLPWKNIKADFSSDSEDDDAFEPVGKLPSLQKKKTNNNNRSSSLSTQPVHPTVEKLRNSDERPKFQRAASVPETCLM